VGDVLLSFAAHPWYFSQRASKQPYQYSHGEQTGKLLMAGWYETGPIWEERRNEAALWSGAPGLAIGGPSFDIGMRICKSNLWPVWR